VQPTFVVELIDLFVADTPAQLDLLRSALAAQDLGALRRIAHSLKASAAFVGAMHLAEACAALEDLARGQTLEGAAQLVAAVAAVGPQAIAALELLRGRFFVPPPPADRP
ncbi:MAG: Hpt domain-containing protein, partial [Chloroflexales bacterium]|nr:Hpt domain-containing protein [Chloroflexales bacterium]